MPPSVNPDPTVDLRRGVDLSDRHAQAEAAARAAVQADEREKLAYARAWDKMMQRAFKGIYTRGYRHSRMRRAAARFERERAEAQA
jgi:hypothetical protein